MSDVLPSSNQPDYGAETFLKAIEQLSAHKYHTAWQSFTRALEQYETQGGSREESIYQVLRFFIEWSRGLAAYSQAELADATLALGSARDMLQKTPESVIKLFSPTIDFFLKIIPLDARLKELFNRPQDLDYLAGGLERLFEPLSELVLKASEAGTPPEIPILLTAKVNICAVLLYLLGRLHLGALIGVMRHEASNTFKDEPERVIQWVLTQEQAALLEIGFNPAQEVILSVNRFATELLRLGAPQKLAQIPEETQSQLLAILSPLNLLDGSLSKKYFFDSSVKQLTYHLKQAFQEHQEWLLDLFKSQSQAAGLPAGQAGVTGKVAVKFPASPESQWEALVLQFIDELTIKATLKGKSRKFSYVELGFKDKRTGNPDTHWQTLKHLADYNGMLTWHTAGSGKHLKRSIYVISRRLKAVFDMPGNPFYPYKRFKGYKTRFKIVKAMDWDRLSWN